MLDRSFTRTVEEAASAWHVPALALGVSAGGREETLALGCAPETVFRIASISKPFTALLAVRLLDLEAPTGVWAPEVRVGHLLSHTSGYDGEHGDLARFGDGDDALASVVRELPGVRRWVGVDECWSYANAGYWLAGYLCAEAADTTFEEALLERVVRPAGLEATSFGPADVAGTGQDAIDAPYPRARRPSGGLASNVPDLLRFGRRLLQAPELRAVRGKPVAGVYGLGLWGERVAGVEVWGHRGSWGGYQTTLLTVPARDAVFVGLTNASRGGNALDRIEDEFLRRVVGEPRRRPETVTLPAADLRAVAGRYSNGDEDFEVEATDDGTLHVTFGDGAYGARPVGPHRFEITEGDRARELFYFPLPGFGRFGHRLAERVA